MGKKIDNFFAKDLFIFNQIIKFRIFFSDNYILQTNTVKLDKKKYFFRKKKILFSLKSSFSRLSMQQILEFFFCPFFSTLVRVEFWKLFFPLFFQKARLQNFSIFPLQFSLPCFPLSMKVLLFLYFRPIYFIFTSFFRNKNLKLLLQNVILIAINRYWSIIL